MNVTVDGEIFEAEPAELDIPSVLAAVREFSVIDGQQKVLAKRATELKNRLRYLIEIEGQEDDKGNLLWPLPETCGDITALQLQCRVSRPFMGEVAEEILRSIPTSEGRTLYDDCVEYVPVLDESKVMAAFYENQITEAQIDTMYPENTTYAFVPIRVKQR
jgi:hypothetical protein